MGVRDLALYFGMANGMTMAQDDRQLTLTLPADMVTVNLDVKRLKGQYMYSLNNDYTDLSFNPWSKDLQPSETFLKIVREMQIEPNSYYLDYGNESESGQ